MPTLDNLKTLTVSGSESYTTSYDYDDNNRLTTETKDTGLTTETAEYQYDANGNQISKTTFTVGSAAGNSEVGIYILGLHRPTPREDYTIEINEYDVFNRLIQVLNDEGTSIYFYKADGLRLSKDVNGEETTHVWDGSNIVLKYGANTDVYLRGINLIKSNAQGYYLFNAHGDVVQRADGSGSVTKSYVYDAFGVETGIDENDTNPFRYAGEYFDVETGSIYLRSRYYVPSIGGFMAEDPIRDGLNWYTYCGGNPIAFVDPSGLMARDTLNTISMLYRSEILNSEHVASLVFLMNSKDLASDTYLYTSLHEMAQIFASGDIRELGYAPILEYSIATGGVNKKGQIIYNEADIVGIGEINNYIWEVKPMGGDPEYQLLKYTQLTGFIRGGYPANNDSGHRLAHINGLYGELDLKMYLSYDGDGGIFYSFGIDAGLDPVTSTAAYSMLYRHFKANTGDFYFGYPQEVYDNGILPNPLPQVPDFRFPWFPNPNAPAPAPAPVPIPWPGLPGLAF